MHLTGRVATRHLLDHKTHLLDSKTHLAGGIAGGYGRFSHGEKEIQEPRATRVKTLKSPSPDVGRRVGMRVDRITADFCVSAIENDYIDLQIFQQNKNRDKQSPLTRAFKRKLKGH
jgi:hypothetical protein